MDYKKLLAKVGIISEEEFNDIISNCPKIQDEKKFIENIDTDAAYHPDDFTCAVIANWLSDNTEYAWIDYADYENKIISIYDYDSQDEAEFVKKTLESFGWNITNFQEEIDNMQDNQDEMDRDYCISKLKKLSVEQLKDICDKL